MSPRRGQLAAARDATPTLPLTGPDLVLLSDR